MCFDSILLLAWFCSTFLAPLPHFLKQQLRGCVPPPVTRSQRPTSLLVLVEKASDTADTGQLCRKKALAFESPLRKSLRHSRAAVEGSKEDSLLGYKQYTRSSRTEKLTKHNVGSAFVECRRDGRIGCCRLLVAGIAPEARQQQHRWRFVRFATAVFHLGTWRRRVRKRKQTSYGVVVGRRAYMHDHDPTHCLSSIPRLIHLSLILLHNLLFRLGNWAWVIHLIRIIPHL